MRVRANGIDIHYEIVGSGPVVAFSHCLGTDYTLWDAQAAALAERYTVLRYDARGHSRSGAPGGDYSWELLCADLLGLLDALDIPRVHHVGLSMGGMLGMHLALQAPQRLASLTVACTASRFPPGAAALWAERIAAVRREGLAAQVEPSLARWFTAPFRAAHPELMVRIGELIRNTPVAGYIGWARLIAAIDLTERLGAVQCPTMVIGGADDPGAPSALQQAIAAAIPGARLEIIPGAAHLANVEQAEVFTRLLGQFLDGAA